MDNVNHDVAAIAVDTLQEAFAGDVSVLDAHPGMSALRHGLPKVLAAFPDHVMELKQVLVDGDRVAAHWVHRGTHQGEIFGIAPTGRAVEFQSVAIMRVEDGRIVQHNHEVGWLRVLMQLGVVGGY